MEKQETHKSPLDNLYDDFDDFDLGQTVERLKKETKMLKDCINEQNKDIDKLANTIVELKATNQTLSGNISSLYSTAKAEIERKDKIIADLQREKDNITFRRKDRYFNNKAGIPQNKNSEFNPEVNNSNYIPQNNNLPQAKKQASDNKLIPNYNRNIYDGSNMDNIFQERYKQERNTYNNEKYCELPVPCFIDESDGKPCNPMDTNIKFEDRFRSRRLEGEGRPCNPLDTNIKFEDGFRSRRLEGEGRLSSPVDTNIKFEDRSRSTRLESEGRPCNPMDTNIKFEDGYRSRRLEGEGRPYNPIDTNTKFEDRSRSRSWENQDTKNFERYNFNNKTDRYNWDGRNRNKSNDRRRDKSNDGRRDKSNDERRDKRYKKEYGSYGESTKRDHSDDNFSRRRYDYRNDNLYGTYERSKSRKRKQHFSEHNLEDFKSYKSTKGKKMLKVVDKIEKEATNMMKSPIPPLEQLLKLPMKKKKGKEDRNNYNEEEEEKTNEKKERNKYEEEVEEKIHKRKESKRYSKKYDEEVEEKVKNKRRDSKTEPEVIENKADSIDNKSVTNNYFGSDYNNVLDNIMENIKYKNSISSTLGETCTGRESTVSEDEFVLMESRFKILNSLTQDNNELKKATACTNVKALEENMQKLFDPNESTEEKLENKNSETTTTNDSPIKTKNEDELNINDSLETDSNHTENDTKEMLTFIETTRTKRAGRLNVDDIFGLDSNDDINKSNEDILTKPNEEDRKNIDFQVDESSKKTDYKSKQTEEISSNKTVDGQNKIKNKTVSNQKNTKKRTEKERLVLLNIFGDESTDIFGEDEDVGEFKKLVQNVAGETSKLQDKLEDAKSAESKFINSNDKNEGRKNKKITSLSEDSYEEGKKTKRKKVQENRNSNTVSAKKHSGDKNKSSAELIKTEATLNEKKKSIKLADGPDANLNLIPVENASDEIEVLKPPQKSEEPSSKGHEVIGNKSKNVKLQIEDKTSTAISTDVSNKKNAELNLIKPAASKVEAVECENGKNSENKIFIVSDVRIVPSAASNKDSNMNKAEVENLPHFKDVSTLNLSEYNDGNKNTSKPISKKERLLERLALEETSNQPSSDLKQQKENTLYCKEYKNTDNNEIVEIKDNVQCFKSKNSEDKNPPKKRKVNLDVVLEDNHVPLNSENVLKNQIKSTLSSISKKTLVSLKDKNIHQPTRRSKRISSKERIKSSSLNVSTEEMGDEEIKRNTSKDNPSREVKNNIIQFKDNETVINSDNQDTIIKQLVNEKIDYISSKKTERHVIDISDEKTDICASTFLHTKTSPVNMLSEKQFISPTLLQTKTVGNVYVVQKSPSLGNLNSTPAATENNNGEVIKTQRRITPTRVKDDPVCSFKNILAKNNNTVKLFSKTVAIETNFEEDNDMPILHLEEITLSNIEDGTQKTFDKSITKLLDCMNMSNLDCDMSKLNIPPKESLTFENTINTVESPTVTNTSAVVEKVVEPITPTKHNLPNLVTSTPKTNVSTCQATTTVFEKDVDTADKTNIASSSANNINSDSNCKTTDNSQVNKEVPSKSVNTPARFRRRCRIIAVVKDV